MQDWSSRFEIQIFSVLFSLLFPQRHEVPVWTFNLSLRFWNSENSLGPFRSFEYHEQTFTEKKSLKMCLKRLHLSIYLLSSFSSQIAFHFPPCLCTSKTGNSVRERCASKGNKSRDFFSQLKNCNYNLWGD